MQTEPNASISEILSQHFPGNADVVAIAGALVRDFHAIERILTPILGPRGVAALLQRSLHVARVDHPWLADALPVATHTLDLAALGAAIERQHHRVDAAGAAIALLHSFHELLASLIGLALTQRLLAPVWALSPSPSADQDTPP